MQTRSFRRGELAVLAALVVIGTILRVAGEPRFPGTLHQDEACGLYEAFALYSEGTDVWGARWPAYFASWGSGQNVLLSYLSIPFVALLGPVPLAIRIVPLVAGISAIPLTADLGRRLRTPEVGLWAAALTALLPWPVMISRWGVESNLLPATLLFAHWLFAVASSARGGRRLWLDAASGVALALCGYAYAVVLFAFPVILIGRILAIRARPPLERPRASLAAFLLPFLVTVLPLFLAMVKNNVPTWYAAFAWLEYVVPFEIPRVERSRWDQVAAPLGVRLTDNLRFLFGGLSDGIPEYSLPNVPPLGFVGMLAALLALLRPARVQSPDPIRIWMASAIVPFVMVPLILTRFNLALYPLILLSAETFARYLGFSRFHGAAKGIGSLARWFGLAAVTAVFVLQTVAFLTRYFDRNRNQFAFRYYEGIFDAFRVAGLSRTSTLFMTQQRTMVSHYYPLLYLRAKPSEFEDRSVDVMRGEGRRRVTRWRGVFFDRALLPRDRPFSFVLIRGEPAPCAQPSWRGDYGIWRVGHCG
jgi:4-amino-4-deoxy-L-arabinose transferase-like glycosyltransferase